MLLSLHIENIAVIRQLDVNFAGGFHALTGETGAGKSILIDSIRLLMGGRADRELVRSGHEKAYVSAVFHLTDEILIADLFARGIPVDENRELYLERTLFADGRSTAKLGGKSVPISLLREAGRLLISIHGQHDSIALLDPDTHIGLLDAYAENGKLLNDYAAIYKELTAVKGKLQKLLHQEKDTASRCEILRYQIQEIDSAKLHSGEEEALSEKKKRLTQAEKIAKNSQTVYRALYQNEKGRSATALITLAREALLALGEFLPEREEYCKRLDFCRAELEDIALQAEALTAIDREDPTLALTGIEDRLAQIEKLCLKYGATVDAVLDYRKKLAQELEEIDGQGSRITDLKKRLSQLVGEATAAAEALRKSRLAAASEMEKAVQKELAFLDLEKVVFRVDVSPSLGNGGKLRFHQQGIDTVEFRISTNPGEPLKPLQKIASGGELSRIMLALKCAFSEKDHTPTLIFDEIDTGVSGRTAEKIGIKLREIGGSAQVFSVTHSAQIAACADQHYRICKNEVDGRNETSLSLLDRDGRVAELSRIIGGIEITPKIIETAKEMLTNQGE